jgi:hypothetical protein
VSHRVDKVKEKMFLSPIILWAFRTDYQNQRIGSQLGIWERENIWIDFLQLAKASVYPYIKFMHP